jgi:hypothetical protein
MATSTILQLKRGTAAEWTSNNPTLIAGRMGLESDTRRFKVGTGAAWNSTAYSGEFFDGLFSEGVAASTPSAGKVALYAKADGLLYSKDDTGAETLVSGGAGGGGGGTPFDGTFAEGAAPTTPSAGNVVVYAKADGLMYSKDDGGVETLMSGGAGGGGGGSGDVVSTAPVFSGPLVTTAYAMPALEINVAKALNTKTVAAASEFSLSDTPTANTRIIWRLTNSDATDRVMTIPSMFSRLRGTSITTFTLPALTTVEIVLVYTGTNWMIFNEPLTVAEAMASLGFEYGNVATKNIPISSKSASYSLVAEDAGGAILHPSADTTPRTLTIPSNASVALPIGTALTFINQASAGALTIAVDTDTMRLAGAGSTGSRTLSANGIATAIKILATEWIISGTNLT